MLNDSQSHRSDLRSEESETSLTLAERVFSDMVGEALAEMWRREPQKRSTKPPINLKRPTAKPQQESR